MRPDVLLFVEHVARELDVACILSSLMRQRYDVNVEVVSLYYDLYRTIGRRRPSIVVTPFFCFADDANIRRMLDGFPGARYVNLAYEQLLSRGNQAFRRPRDEVVQRHVLHLASGPAFRRFLCRHGVAASNVVVVGSLRLALGGLPYRNMAAGRREELARRFGLDRSKPWVFFPENYSAAFLSDKELSYRMARGYPQGRAEAYRCYARRSLAAVAGWCRQAASLGAAELIVRPRPGTSLAIFRSAFTQATGGLAVRGLHFIKEGTVAEWNLASDAVVTSYSSTAVEAAVAGKPVYLLEPEPLPGDLAVEWLRHAPRIVRVEQFIDLVRDPRRAPPADALVEWAEQNLLGWGDPLDSAANLIGRMALDARLGPPPPRPADRRRCPLQQRAAARIRGWISKRCRLHPRYEADRFTRDELRRRTEAWADLLAGVGRRGAGRASFSHADGELACKR